MQGVAEGCHTKGPSKVLGANLTGHAHACTIILGCGTIESIGGQPPFAFWTLKEGAGMFSREQLEQWKLGQKETICQFYSFSVEWENWGWTAGKLSGVIP